MKKTESKQKKVQKTVKQRNKYSLDHKAQAKRYYLIGLNMQEISKLLDGCPVRTLEKWQAVDQWTALKTGQSIKQRVFELHESGKTYNEIAELVQISYCTVWRYIKAAKRHKEGIKQA